MKRNLFNLILATVLLHLFAIIASAQPPARVPPGNSIHFTAASNGDIKRSDDPRIRAGISGSTYTVKASALSIAGGAITSFAFLYNEFTVTGDVPRSVSAQISATAKWDGQLVVGGFGGANASADIALTLIDVTAGFRQVAGVKILSAKAAQPISITPGGISQNESGEQAVGFQADLIRGHTYRLLFRLDCAADGTAGSAASDFIDGEKQAKLSNLTVLVGADTIELLEMIKSTLSALTDEISSIKNVVNNVNNVVNTRLDVAVSTRASQVSVNQVQSTVTIIDRKADEILKKLTEFQRDALRAQIEAALVEGDRYNVTWYQMPKAAGGYLELVREIVKETIDEATQAGMPSFSGTSLSLAQKALAQGDIYYTAKSYKDAYDHYRAAYLNLSIVPGQHRP